MVDDFGQLFDFLDDDALRMPVKSMKYPEGKVYAIPSPSAEVGLRLQALATISAKVERKMEVTKEDAARLQLDDDQEREFIEQVLGAAYGEMKADGVSWVRIQKVTQYAYVAFTQSKAAADKAAAEGLFSGGKVQALNREARRHPTEGQSGRPASTGSRSRKRRRR